MIGIYYGSSTGNTEAAANDIAAALGVDAANIHNVSDTDASTVADYDTLLLGSSTWGAATSKTTGMTSSTTSRVKISPARRWVSSVAVTLTATLTRSAVLSFRSTTALQDTGATFVGAYEPEGYQVTDSELNRDGKFLGLALDAADEENNPERIAKWVELVK